MSTTLSIIESEQNIKALREMAKKYFVEAEYLDSRPRRSNRAMRQMVRDVAAEKGVPMCDAAKRLDAMDAQGLAADVFFMDPCHPTPKGHRALAEILLACTLESGLLPQLGDNQALLARLNSVVGHIPLAGSMPYRLDHLLNLNKCVQIFSLTSIKYYAQ